MQWSSFGCCRNGWKQISRCTKTKKHGLHYIPRINLIVEESENAPLKWRRREFPVEPAFALTINKRQGQSLDRVLIWLWDIVFSHGPLYVAASNIHDPMNIRFFIRSDDGELKAKNIVYTDILI